MSNYQVDFLVRGSLTLKAKNEHEAFKNFWEQENKVLFHHVEKHPRINKKTIYVECLHAEPLMAEETDDFEIVEMDKKYGI